MSSPVVAEPLQPQTSVVRKFIPVLKVLVLGGIAFTAIMGALHMPFGRALLRKLGGCPVAPVDAASYDAARLSAAQGLKGTVAAPRQPAAGFVMRTTTRAEVDSWVETYRLACKQQADGAMLQCSNVPTGAIREPGMPPVGLAAGPIDDIVFGFDPQGKLANLTLARAGLPAAQAEAIIQAWRTRREAELGKPAKVMGETTAVFLESSPYSSAIVQHRFTDYFAEVTATSFPQRGVRIQEQYMSTSK